MTTAQIVDIDVNPANSAQRYILWSNGRVDSIGGAPAITSGPNWYDRIDQPVGVALHITNWANGQGYILDYTGKFNPLNGAATMGTAGYVSGVPQASARTYVDWAWNTNGSAQGYVLDHYGKLYAWGGAPAPPRSGPRWAHPIAKRLRCRWTPDIRVYTLDQYGTLWPDHNAVVIVGGPYWAGWDAARDFFIVDWDLGKGYVLDLYGGHNPFGGATPLHGFPYKQGVDCGRRHHCLDTVVLIFWIIWDLGQQHEVQNPPSPPSVIAGGVGTVSPPSTVTTTMRPTLAWTYSDPANNAQAQWQVYAYTNAFVAGHSMTDPSVWASSAVGGFQTGVDPARRGVVLPIDLGNDSYTFYVRAQSQTGLWSAWSSYTWTQAFPSPAAPTSLTAVPDNTAFQVHLSASNNLTGNQATSTIFEYSEDLGTTWNAVRGAEQLPIAATNLALDADVPLGVSRQYRARVYAMNPRWISNWSNIVTAVVTNRKYVLTSTANPALGGEVYVTDTPKWTRTSKAGVFGGVGAKYPVVVSDGIPKARQQTITVECDGAAQWELVRGLVDADDTLVFRDPFGDVTYCRIVGDVTRAQQWKRPYPTEASPLRHNHLVTIPLIEVQPPLLLDLGNTLPPGPIIIT